ncbi:MAG: hypothetical protein CMN77_00775 [Spirochaetaceae bacterium]|nr:hypothetical protein [Spirochaetaceae bacterium]|tara:strand:+ start:49312 stop:50751 length:1440 start_codon:yes stop_codon:yes gene_type:complete
MSTNQKVAVIGAGPAGMSAAYCLARAGLKDVDVYEASDSVGGLARTIELWNQDVDIGPHRFFSSDKRVNELWLEVAQKDYKMVNRLTRIYYKKKFYYYPLKPFNALFNLGIFQALLCVLSYGKQRIAPTPEDGSFEAWVTRRFGKRLFRIFFKTYTEKLWGIPCEKLDSDFAAQRIKKLSLYEAIKNAILPSKKNKHKTLVDQFAYPVGGTGAIYERMAESVKQRGGSVHLNSPVQNVIQKDGKATGLQLEDGTVKEYDHIISTMPLTLMVTRLPEVPEDILERTRKLKFRNTIIVFLNINALDLFPDQWLYVHSPELDTGRITNFRNWIPEVYGQEKTTILALELWCYDEDPVWKETNDSLIEKASREIRSTGLIGKSEILGGHVYRIPRCYPVYDTGYKENLEPVENYLSSVKNLHVIGRYGAFKYNNQDHSILMGMLAAENIVENRNHNLWEINTDYETYQESYVITETGLSKQGE